MRQSSTFQQTRIGSPRAKFCTPLRFCAFSTSRCPPGRSDDVAAHLADEDDVLDRAGDDVHVRRDAILGGDDLLRPHRQRDRRRRPQCQPGAGARSSPMPGASTQAALAVETSDDAVDEVRLADEVGDETGRRLIVELGRAARTARCARRS